MDQMLLVDKLPSGGNVGNASTEHRMSRPIYLDVGFPLQTHR